MNDLIFLSLVAEENIPLILKAVEVQYSQYPTNYWAENHLIVPHPLCKVKFDLCLLRVL